MMPMINWRARIKNRMFWLTLIPAALLLIRAVAALFGYALELDGAGDILADAVNSVFALLALLGVVNDPTTPGVCDAARAPGSESGTEA